MLTIDNIKLKSPVLEVDYKPNNKKSIESIKKDIGKLLKQLNKKIIIIVDDIDRLTDKETEFIFRLTKGIADFDNLIYILLYDKNIVTRSLQTFKKENGEKYLEKIVQYSLPVPKPHRRTMYNLLFDKLDNIIKNVENDRHQIISNQNIGYILDRVIDSHIITIRDINSIVNVVSFEYPIIAEDVNFADFFLISLIRIKNITLYELIKISRYTDYDNILNGHPEYKNILSLLLV